MATTKTLSEMLEEVEEQFYGRPAGPPFTYLFHLGKFPEGWEFRVVDDWNRWRSAGLTYEFGRFAHPEEAVEAFLDYVRTKGIDVAGLQK